MVPVLKVGWCARAFQVPDIRLPFRSQTLSDGGYSTEIVKILSPKHNTPEVLPARVGYWFRPLPAPALARQDRPPRPGPLLQVHHAAEPDRRAAVQSRP